MSKSSENKYYEDKSDVIVGIIALTVIALMFAWMIIAANNGSRYAGSIVTAEEVRRGSETTLVYKSARPMKKGETVRWFVDGKEVGSYVVGNENEVTFTPSQVGSYTVEARIGKNFRKMRTVNVMPPKMNVVAQDATVVYGDELPEFCCDTQGILDEDCCESPCYECRPTCEGKLTVGSYPIEVCGDCCFKDYEVECRSATLTVLPKEVFVKQGVTKVYDKNDVCYQTVFEIEGLVKGDNVVAVCDEAKFCGVNAGTQMIQTTNLRLEGEDAGNYVLNQVVYGEILPKTLTVEGICAYNKAYDGTAKAEIKNVGRLVGVCAGDNVAIGGMEAYFDDSEPGTRTVNVRATLVGVDKENYALEEIALQNAEIFEPEEQ